MEKLIKVSFKLMTKYNKYLKDNAHTSYPAQNPRRCVEVS